MDINYFFLFQQQKALLQAIISFFVNITFFVIFKIIPSLFFIAIRKSMNGILIQNS